MASFTSQTYVPSSDSMRKLAICVSFTSGPLNVVTSVNLVCVLRSI